MHLVFLNTWGIGSIQVSLLFFLGVFAGRATDAGHFRLVYITGAFFQAFGFFVLSLCKNYRQIFLAQGVCMGVGNGLTFGPGLAVTSSYFSKNRGLAVGSSAAGTATGGMIYPVLIHQLLDIHGLSLGWTVRITAFVMLTTQLSGLLFFHPRLPPRPSGPILDSAAFSLWPSRRCSAVCFPGDGNDNDYRYPEDGDNNRHDS
ncbi:hypothetical protein BDW68DRAFT_182031 [Aspergillus falconensis]